MTPVASYQGQSLPESCNFGLHFPNARFIIPSPSQSLRWQQVPSGPCIISTPLPGHTLAPSTANLLSTRTPCAALLVDRSSLKWAEPY